MAGYYDFYALVESAVEADIASAGFKMMGEPVKRPDGSLSYLRYTGVMCEVGKRNRNRRLWTKQILDVMMHAPHIVEQFRRAGGLPGENGHPIPATAQVTMDRLVTIDPNNLAILMKEWWWDGDRMMAIVETLDQGEGTPGNRMMMNMLQGMTPAHSIRTIVPQRHNPDGTIDVTAPGRFICTDRVIGPSCENAYLDVSVPVKNIITKSDFDVVMESWTDYALSHSEATKTVLGAFEPGLEAVSMDMNTGTVMGKVKDYGLVAVPLERNYRRDIAAFMRSRH